MIMIPNFRFKIPDNISPFASIVRLPYSLLLSAICNLKSGIEGSLVARTLCLASILFSLCLVVPNGMPGTAPQLSIAFRPMYFYDSPKAARVMIVARIGMENLGFKNKGAQIGTDLNVTGVAYAEDGSIAARFIETVPVSLGREQEAEFRKGNLSYRNHFRLRPGKYRLTLEVTDESSNRGSTERSLEVPAITEKELSGSSIVIAEQISRLPDMIQNLQTQMLNESDPLIYAGMQIEPSVGNRLPANSIIPILFRIYNLPIQASQRDLTAKARLVGENRTEFALDPIPLQKDAAPPNKTEAVIALRLLFKDVPPAKYRLIIETADAASAQKVELQTDLELVPNP